MSESTEQQIKPKRTYNRRKPVLTNEQKIERQKNYYLKYKALLGPELQQQKRNLKKLNIEQGKYVCNICDKKYGTSDAINKHNTAKYHIKMLEMYDRLTKIESGGDKI